MLIDPVKEVYVTLKKGVPDFTLKPMVTGGEFTGYLLQSKTSQYGVQPVWAHQLMSSMAAKSKLKPASANAEIMEQINAVRALKPPTEAPQNKETVPQKRSAPSPKASPLKAVKTCGLGHGLVVASPEEVLTPKILPRPSAAAESAPEKSPLEDNSQDLPRVCIILEIKCISLQRNVCY